MANETAAKPNDELDDLAFQLFKERIASQPIKRGLENEAADAYRKADAFLAVRAKIRRGEMKPKEPEGIQLADCCCPNEGRNHPYNLVAKRYTDRKGTEIKGDLSRIARINAWLDKNPPSATEPENVVNRLNRDFPELDWKLEHVEIARTIFPTYCTKN